MDDDDELEETEFEGFADDAETLCACNVDGGYMRRRRRGAWRWWTPRPASARAMDPGATRGFRDRRASGNRTQILVAVSGGTLVSLAAGAAGDAMDTGAEDHLLREVASRELGEEVACLDCSPLSDPIPRGRIRGDVRGGALVDGGEDAVHALISANSPPRRSRRARAPPSRARCCCARSRGRRIFSPGWATDSCTRTRWRTRSPAGSTR